MITNEEVEIWANECVDIIDRYWSWIDTLVIGRLGVRLTKAEAIKVCRRALEKMEAAQ